MIPFIKPDIKVIESTIVMFRGAQALTPESMKMAAVAKTVGIILI